MRIEVNHKILTIEPKITSLGSHQLFLGISFLKRHNPDIDWQKLSFKWRHEGSPIMSLTKILSNSIYQIFEQEINVTYNTSQKLFNAAEKKKESDPLKAVPKKFHLFLKVFNKTESEKFPPRRPWDHKIELEPTFKPKRMPVYHLTPKESEEMEKFINENLRKGYIRKSKSPMASSFFFVGKKGNELRPCQDYRYLNQHTIKNAHPIPSIARIMDKLKGSNWFTKLDV